MHRNPDADAIAAAIVIQHIISTFKPLANFFIVSDEEFRVPFPKHLQPKTRIIKNSEIPLNSTAIIIDHSRQEVSLLRNGKNSAVRKIVIIDHHYFSNEPGIKPKTLIDERAYSTCEVLYDYLKAETTVKITKEIALALYIGIFTDSLYFQTPLKSKQIKMLADLVGNYGADIDKHQLYFRGKYFLFKKLVSEIIFLHANKASDSNTVTIGIPHRKVEKLKNNYIFLTHIATEVLTTRGVNNVIIRFQNMENLGNIYVATNHRNAIKDGNTKGQRANSHYYYNLKDNEAKTLQNNLKKRFEEYERSLKPIDNGEAIPEVVIE